MVDIQYIDHGHGINMRTGFDSRYWTLSLVGLVLVLAFAAFCRITGWEPQLRNPDRMPWSERVKLEKSP